MRLLITALLAAGTLAAQQQGPVVSSSRGLFNQIKDAVLKSADRVPEDMWSWQPTPQVRTFGQLFAHIADGQYEFCSATTGTAVHKNIETTVKGKAATVAALKEAFAYCDGIYANLTEADAVALVPGGRRPMAKIVQLDFNTAHTNEHYGNLVTYMRLKGIVPPTSQQ